MLGSITISLTLNIELFLDPSFCFFIRFSKICSSTAMPLSEAIVIVRSMGNPYVSCNLKAISPLIISDFFFGKFSSKILIPEDNVLKNNSSSSFNIPFIDLKLVNSLGKSLSNKVLRLSSRAYKNGPSFPIL